MSQQDPGDDRTMTSMSDAAPDPTPAPEPPIAPEPVAPGRPSRRKRPFALLILVGLMLLRAILMLAVIAGAFLADPKEFAALPLPDIVTDTEVPLLLAAILGPFAVLLIAAGIGLLRFQRRAWLVAMVITGLFVLLDIIGFLTDTGSDVWMLLNIITVFYLNQRDVRELVGDAAPAAAVAGAAA